MMDFRTFKRKYLPHETWNRWYWYLRGKPSRTPDEVKRHAVRTLARKHHIRVLVETGTYHGEMVEAMRRHFRLIHSIEIYQPLYLMAVERFAGAAGIHLHHGDSEALLPIILDTLNEPALFWLDAHYSGEGTGRGNLDTPLIKELQSIFAHPIKNHLILIDDARCFQGQDGYPTLNELRDLIKSNRPQSEFVVRDDIMRIGMA